MATKSEEQSARPPGAATMAGKRAEGGDHLLLQWNLGLLQHSLLPASATQTDTHTLKGPGTGAEA